MVDGGLAIRLFIDTFAVSRGEGRRMRASDCSYNAFLNIHQQILLL